MDEPCSSADYVSWWFANIGATDSYTVADHFEWQMRGVGSFTLLRRCGSLEALHAMLEVRYGPLLAAEAFRRALHARVGDAKPPA